MLFGIMALTRRNLRAVTAVILALAAGSALLMAALYRRAATRRAPTTAPTPGPRHCSSARPSRCSSRCARHRARRIASVALQVCGAIGAVFLTWVVVAQSERWTTLYRGGFSLVAIASAVLIAGAMTRGPVRTLLSVPPLPAIGLISYGLYLWHWPIYVWLSPDRTGLAGHRLLALRLVVTFAVAILSFRLVERPIREQRVSWIRGRAAWIPITSVVTAIALLLLTASGVAARPRPDLSTVEQFTRILNAPPPPGATRVLLAGDSVAVTLGFDAVRPSQRKDIWLRGVARVGCGLLTGTPVSGDTRRAVPGGVPRLAGAVRQGRAHVRAGPVTPAHRRLGGVRPRDRRTGPAGRDGTDGGRAASGARPGPRDPHRERLAPRDPHDPVLLADDARARRVR